MTREEMIDIAHSNWSKVADVLYYGTPGRGASLEFHNSIFMCWDRPGPLFLFKGQVGEVQAVAVAQTDPEEVIAEYARRAAERLRRSWPTWPTPAGS